MTSANGRVGRGRRFWYWVRRTPSTVLTAVGGVLATTASILDNDFIRANGADIRPFGKRIEGEPVFLAVGAICIALGVLWGTAKETRQQDRNQRLLQDNEELRRDKAQLEGRYADTLAAVSGMGTSTMFRLSKDLGLGNTERATLVVVDNNHFRQVGRYAHRPQYAAPGREQYPLTHGCMGVAWTQGAAEVKKLRSVLDYVINKTKPMYWAEFLSLVYSTYPVRTRPKYSELDLVQLASEYRVHEPSSDE